MTFVIYLLRKACFIRFVSIVISRIRFDEVQIIVAGLLCGVVAYSVIPDGVVQKVLLFSKMITQNYDLYC